MSASIKASPEDVRVLLLHLAARGAWATSAELCPVLGWTDRYLRAVANAANGEVITGDLGYLHMTVADEELVTHSLHRLGSQTDKMHLRIAQIRAAWAREKLRRAHASAPQPELFHVEI